MEYSECLNNSENIINDEDSSHVIELRKTADITLIKGWRNKQFKINSTKDLSECRNYTLLCDDLKNYDNDDLLTENNDVINLDSLRVVLSNEHYKKIGEKIKSSCNSDFMQSLMNKIDKDKSSSGEIENESSGLDCKINKNSENNILSLFLDKNEKFLTNIPLTHKKNLRVDDTTVKTDSKSESSFNDDGTCISYHSRTSVTRSSISLDQDCDPFIQKPRTVYEKRMLYKTKCRNENSSELVTMDESQRDFQYIDQHKKYDNNFRFKDSKEVSNEPCINDVVNKSKKLSPNVLNGNLSKVNRRNKLRVIKSNMNTSIISRKISKKFRKRLKLKSTSRKLKALSNNSYFTFFPSRLDQVTTAFLETYVTKNDCNVTDYQNDKGKPVMVMHLGVGRCLFKEQVTNLNLLRKQDWVISEKWARYSVATVVDKKGRNELTKIMVPVVFPLLIRLMEKTDKLRLTNKNISTKIINKSLPTVNKNETFSVNNDKSNKPKGDNHSNLKVSENFKLDSGSIISRKSNNKPNLKTRISDKTVSLPNAKSKLNKKLQDSNEALYNGSERKLIGMYDTNSIRGIISEVAAQSEACNEKIKGDSPDKSKSVSQFKRLNDDKKRINQTDKPDTSLNNITSVLKSSPADPSNKSDRIADSDTSSQISLTDSDISENSPTKKFSFSNRIVDKVTGRVKYTGKLRRVALELKRLNSAYLEIDDSSKENSGENLNDSSNPDDISNSISSDNLTNVLPDDITNRLAKVEKDYHQTVMKSKDKMIFVSKYSERNKRAKKLPKKLEDTVWKVKDMDYFENALKNQDVKLNKVIRNMKNQQDNYDEKMLHSVTNYHKSNDSCAELRGENTLRNNRSIKKIAISPAATNNSPVRSKNLIQVCKGEEVDKSEIVHPASLKERKKVYFGGKSNNQEESIDSNNSGGDIASKSEVKFLHKVQSIDVKSLDKIVTEGKVVPRHRSSIVKKINDTLINNTNKDKKDLCRLKKMKEFRFKKSITSSGYNESDKLLEMDMKSVSKVEDNKEKELRKLKNGTLRYNNDNLQLVETQSMTELHKNQPSDIVDSKLSSKIIFKENSVIVQTTKSILKPNHLRMDNISDIHLFDKENRNGVFFEKFLIVKVQKMKIPDKIRVWCMDHKQYDCFCLKHIEKSNNVAKKRMHPLFCGGLRNSKQLKLKNTFISDSNSRCYTNQSDNNTFKSGCTNGHDFLKFLGTDSVTIMETDKTKTDNNIDRDQNVSEGQPNSIVGCLNNDENSNNSLLINETANQMDVNELNIINSCTISELSEKIDCLINEKNSDNSSLINENNHISVNEINIINNVVAAKKTIVQENDGNVDSKSMLIIDENDEQSVLIPRIESVRSLHPEEFYNDFVWPKVDMSDTVTTQSNNFNNCVNKIQDTGVKAVSSSILKPEPKSSMKNYPFSFTNGYRFFCIYVRRTKFSYLQFLGGPNTNVKIPYEGITDLLVEAMQKQKCFHRPLKNLSNEDFSKHCNLSFGIYAVPNESAVYFGPYGPDEPHRLRAYAISIKMTKKHEDIVSKLLPFVAPAFVKEFTVPHVLAAWWDFNNCKASHENIFSLLKTASRFNGDSFPTLQVVSILKSEEQSHSSLSVNEKNQSTRNDNVKLVSLKQQSNSLIISNKVNLNILQKKGNNSFSSIQQSEPCNNNNKIVNLHKVIGSSNTSKSIADIPEKCKPPCALKSILKSSAATTSLNSTSSCKNVKGEFKPLSPPFTIKTSPGNIIADTLISSPSKSNSKENTAYKLNIPAGCKGLSSSLVNANVEKSASSDEGVTNTIGNSSLNDDSQPKEDTNDIGIIKNNSESKFVKNPPNIKAIASSSSPAIPSVNKSDPVLLCQPTNNMPILVNVLPDGNVVPIPLQKIDEGGKILYFSHKTIDFGADQKNPYDENVSVGITENAKLNNDTLNEQVAPNNVVSPNGSQKSKSSRTINNCSGKNFRVPLNPVKTSVPDSALNSKPVSSLAGENLNFNNTTTVNTFFSDNICNERDEFQCKKYVPLLVRETGKKFKNDCTTISSVSKSLPKFKRSKITAKMSKSTKLLPADLGNKSDLIVHINPDNAVCTTDSTICKFTPESKQSKITGKQLLPKKSLSTGLCNKSNSVGYIHCDKSMCMADSAISKSLLDSKQSKITSKQSSSKLLSTGKGNKTDTSVYINDDNDNYKTESVLHKPMLEPTLCKFNTEQSLSKLSSKLGNKSDSIVFIGDDNVVTKTKSSVSIPEDQSQRSKAARQSSSLTLLSDGLLDTSDAVLLDNIDNVSLVPIKPRRKRTSVSKSIANHLKKLNVEVTLSSAVSNSSSLSTIASQKRDGKKGMSKSITGYPIDHIDDNPLLKPPMEFIPLESPIASVNSKRTENVAVHSTNADQPYNIKLVTQLLEREWKYEQFLLRPGEQPPQDIPKSVLLCSIPKIGYVTLLHNEVESVLLEDPRDSEQVLKFSNLNDASTWLNEFLRMNLVFEENTRLPTWNIIEDSDFIKKLQPFSINLFKKYTLVSVKGVHQFDHIDICDPFDRTEDLDELCVKRWICELLRKRKKYADIDCDHMFLFDIIVDEIKFLESQERKLKGEKEKLLFNYNELVGKRRKLFAEKGVYFSAEGRIFIRRLVKGNNEISSNKESERQKNPRVDAINSFKRAIDDRDKSLKSNKMVNSLEILDFNDEINPSVKTITSSDEVSAVQSEKSKSVGAINDFCKNVSLCNNKKLRAAIKVEKRKDDMDGFLDVERKKKIMLTENRVIAIKEKYSQIRKLKEALNISTSRQSKILQKLKLAKMKRNEAKSVVINIGDGDDISCSFESPKRKETTSVIKGQKQKNIDVESSKAPVVNKDFNVVDDSQLKSKSNKQRKKDNVLIVSCKQKKNSTSNVVLKTNSSVERRKKIDLVSTGTLPPSKKFCDSQKTNDSSPFKASCQKLKTPNSKGNLLHVIRFNTSLDILKSIGSNYDSHQLKVSKAGLSKSRSKHSDTQPINFSQNISKQLCNIRRKPLFKSNKIKKKVSLLNRHVLNRKLDQPKIKKVVRNQFQVSSSVLGSHEVSIFDKIDGVMVTNDKISEGNLTEDINRLSTEKLNCKSNSVERSKSNSVIENNVISHGVSSSCNLNLIGSGDEYNSNDGSLLYCNDTANDRPQSIPADCKDAVLRQKSILQIPKLITPNDQSNNSNLALKNLMAKSRKFVLAEPKLNLPKEVNDCEFYSKAGDLSLSKSSETTSTTNGDFLESWESFLALNNNNNVGINSPNFLTADDTHIDCLTDVSNSENINETTNDKKVHSGINVSDNTQMENSFTGYRNSNLDDDIEILNDDQLINRASSLFSNVKVECDDENGVGPVDIKTVLSCSNRMRTLDSTCSEKYYIDDDGKCLVVVSDSDDDDETSGPNSNMLFNRNLVGDKNKDKNSFVDSESEEERLKKNVCGSYYIVLDNGMVIDITLDDARRLYNHKNYFSTNKGTGIIHKNKLNITEPALTLNDLYNNENNSTNLNQSNTKMPVFKNITINSVSLEKTDNFSDSTGTHQNNITQENILECNDSIKQSKIGEQIFLTSFKNNSVSSLNEILNCYENSERNSETNNAIFTDFAERNINLNNNSICLFKKQTNSLESGSESVENAMISRKTSFEANSKNNATIIPELENIRNLLDVDVNSINNIISNPSSTESNLTSRS